MNNINRVVCEYIWIGGNNEIRSKTRVFHDISVENCVIGKIPEWNYDGSSTDQADSDGNTEVLLKPCAIYKDMFRCFSNCECLLVLCDTYNYDDIALSSNHRNKANVIFSEIDKEECWFGLEQEYFIRFNNQTFEPINNGTHYCGVSNKLEKTIVEEHLQTCITTGLEISGINAEVASGQWEFQIGPSKGISAADQLIISRYLLERIAEKYNATIDYSPKLSENANGSGCHINFSTKDMREPGGLNKILSCMDKLKMKQEEHISAYGKNNHLRLTGLHETSCLNNFTKRN
jgi:glutamine synthetase